MSLQKLLAPILAQSPQIKEDMQVDILREIPTETLFMALKNADSQVVQWFFENALPEQVQGLIHIDCWKGDRFLPERFEIYFKNIALLSPPKIAEYMQELDSEILIRSLMEYCDVLDFDPQEPPNLPESQLLLSPDSKYVLVLKTDRTDIREMLYLWLQKFSAANIELMRRHLESCKWEQPSDLEEFAYQIKKGRIEEMGFVEEHEALALYSVGKSMEVKKALLAKPLPESSKQGSHTSEEDVFYQVSNAFLPLVIEKPVFAEGFFYEAFKKISDKELREILLQELLRVINASLSADNLIHSPLEVIGHGSFRARAYLDLGLSFLSDGNLSEAVRLLKITPFNEVYRLGWLVIHDIVQAEEKLHKILGSHFFGGIDDSLRSHLKGRHPLLSPEEIKDLGLDNPSLMHPTSAYLLGKRMADYFLLVDFFQKNLGGSLKVNEQPIKNISDSVYRRLMTALFREGAKEGFSIKAVTQEEWPQLVKSFEYTRFAAAKNALESRVPPEALSLFQRRLDALSVELFTQIKASPLNLPQARYFNAILVEA